MQGRVLKACEHTKCTREHPAEISEDAANTLIPHSGEAGMELFFELLSIFARCKHLCLYSPLVVYRVAVLFYFCFEEEKSVEGRYVHNGIFISA